MVHEIAGEVGSARRLIADPAQKIARPRQVYTGQAARDVVPIENRVAVAADPTA
jgi:citrate synthase